MQSNSTVILVGGFGFVGRNVLEVMNTQDAFGVLRPAVIDNLANAAPNYKSLDLPAYHGNYQDPDALTFLDTLESGTSGTGGRIFVFLAGETRVAESRERPMDFIAANIDMPSRFVLDAIRPQDHFILISTAGALFDGTFEVRKDSAYCPKNFYGATKAAEELILQKLVEQRGATYSAIRLTNVYGRFSEQKKSAIHVFVRSAIAGHEIVINGDGQQKRDFVYAGDVGRAIATQALRVHENADLSTVNMVGSGVSSPLTDVVHAIETASGKKLRCKTEAATDLLKTEPRHVIANSHDVRDLLQDGVTPLQEGIRQTLAYYLDQ